MSGAGKPLHLTVRPQKQRNTTCPENTNHHILLRKFITWNKALISFAGKIKKWRKNIGTLRLIKCYHFTLHIKIPAEFWRLKAIRHITVPSLFLDLVYFTASHWFNNDQATPKDIPLAPININDRRKQLQHTNNKKRDEWQVGLYQISAPAPAGSRHFFQIRQKSVSGKNPTTAR